MGRKLFISNLDFEITSAELTDMFNEIGSTISVVIATDRESGRSRGFAFIEMETDEAAAQAIEQLNNKVVNGRPMKVVEDRGKTGGATTGPRGEEGGRRYEPLPPIQRTQLFKKKRKLDPFLDDPNLVVDYKDVTLLSRFVSERGKILSRRMTGLSAYHQRKVSKAVKRAQNLGLMPFSNQ
jgi:small subunit ribosomal protein S18